MLKQDTILTFPETGAERAGLEAEEENRKGSAGVDGHQSDCWVGVKANKLTMSQQGSQNPASTKKASPAKGVPASPEQARPATPHNYSTQYYTPSQFLSGPSTTFSAGYTSLRGTFDSDYALFMAEYGGAGPSAVTSEAKRATRQMSHYFDVKQYRTQIDGQASTSIAPVEPKKKLTKKDLEEFKRRKLERKKIKHRWLYE